MKIQGEKTFFGEEVTTPERFIEYLYDSVNNIYKSRRKIRRFN